MFPSILEMHAVYQLPLTLGLGSSGLSLITSALLILAWGEGQKITAQNWPKLKSMAEVGVPSLLARRRRFLSLLQGPARRSRSKRLDFDENGRLISLAGAQISAHALQFGAKLGFAMHSTKPARQVRQTAVLRCPGSQT